MKKVRRVQSNSRVAPLKILARAADVDAGLKALRRTCPVICKAHDVTGLPSIRRRPGGLAGLIRIVNGQQLSVASAAAIHTRTEAAIQPFTADRLLATPDETLRACGLSRPKIKTVRAIAEAVAGGLDLDGLALLPPGQALAQLTAVSGIGPWTAEIYLMFCLGHADVFASGDLALQIAAQQLMGLEARPSTKQMAEIAQRWQPHRHVAALVLWAYYAAMKKQSTALPV